MLINTKELAKRLAVHPNTVFNMVKDGRITPIYLSSTEMRFDYDEVIRQLKERK